MKRNLLAAMLAAVLMASCLGGSAIAFAEEVGYIQDIAYLGDDNKDHFLDIFGFEEGGELKPLVMEVHGGGFFGGSKETNTDHSRFYEENGFAVVTPNYTHLPAGNFTNIVQEMFAVMHWIEENAETYNFDLNNAFISGDSAGGFIVMLTSAVMNSEELREYYGVENPGFQFKMLVLSCPVFDIMANRDYIGKDLGFKSFAAEKIADVIMDDDHMAHVDLLTNFPEEGVPDIYIVTTPGDDILYEDALMLDEFLTERDHPHSVAYYYDRENELEHVFNINKPDYEESIGANTDIVHAMKWMID